MDSGFAQGIKKILHVGEEQKELVDPYLVFSFAGKKVRHFKALSKFVDCNNLSTCLVILPKVEFIFLSTNHVKHCFTKVTFTWYFENSDLNPHKYLNSYFCDFFPEKNSHSLQF